LTALIPIYLLFFNASDAYLTEIPFYYTAAITNSSSFFRLSETNSKASPFYFTATKAMPLLFLNSGKFFSSNPFFSNNLLTY
jgi:hypothetical protein